MPPKLFDWWDLLNELSIRKNSQNTSWFDFVSLHEKNLTGHFYKCHICDKSFSESLSEHTEYHIKKSNLKALM